MPTFRATLKHCSTVPAGPAVRARRGLPFSSCLLHAASESKACCAARKLLPSGLLPRQPTTFARVTMIGCDRKSVVLGKRVSVRVDHGGGSIIQKTNNTKTG